MPSYRHICESLEAAFISPRGVRCPAPHRFVKTWQWVQGGGRHHATVGLPKFEASGLLVERNSSVSTDGKVGYTAVTFTPAETRRGSPPPPHGGTAEVGLRTALSAGVPARTPVNGRHDFFARAQPLGHSEGNCAMVKSIPRISRELRITAARGPLETDSVPLYPTSTDYSALGCIERERRRFRRPSPFACLARSWRSSFSLYSCAFSVAGVGFEPT